MKFQSQLQITTAAAVPPLTVNQTALVTNLNADLLDGQHGAYYATAASLSGYLPLTGGTLTGTLTGTVGIFTTLRATELTSILGSNGPITITPDGTGHVHINSTDIRIGPNNTNATLATRGTGDLILRTHEGSAVEGFIRIYDGANGNIEITPNGTGTVVVGKLSGSTASFSGQITSTLATGTAPLVITSTTAVNNLNADLLDGQHGSYYQNAGNLNAGTVPLAQLSGSYNIDITGSSAFVFVHDTRSSVTGPQTGYRQVRADFLNNSTDGLSDGGTYHGVLTFQQWADSSGGGTRQLAFTDNDNLWIRGSGTGLTAYNPWKLVLNSVNYSTYALPLSGGTLTGQLFSNSKIETAGTITGSILYGAGTGLTGTAPSLTAGAVPWTGVTGKPTTLVGYGITDALPLAGGTLSGLLTAGAGITMTGGRLYVSSAASGQTYGGTIHIRDDQATGANNSFAGIAFSSAPGADFVIGKYSNAGVARLQIRNHQATTLVTIEVDGSASFAGGLTATNFTGPGTGLTGTAAGLSIGGSAVQLNGQAASFYQNAGNLNAGILLAARMPAFTGGDVTSTAGTVALTLANSGVTAGTYRSVTTDAKGRVTAGTNPTTLAGYGITDALPLTGGTLTGALNGTTASFSGNVKGGRVTLRDDCLEQHVDDSDSVGVFVNYFGFASGTTRFRNFGVFNGKNQQLFYITGSTGAAQLNGQLSVNGTTASDILRLYTTGSTIWKLGVTDASGSLFNITADFGNFTINKTNGNVTTPGAFVGANFSGPGTGLTGTAASLTAGAVPWSGVTGKPTTLAGYGITDALPLSGGTLTGGLTGTSANFNGTFIQTGEAHAVDACAIVHNSNVESYYQLSRRLQAFSHLGSTTTLEIEAVTLGNGGYAGEAQRTTWRISSRGALYVTRHDEHGGAGKVFLKILNDTAVPDANGQDAKYVVGLVCGNTTDYVMVWMRARFLQDSGTSRWVTIARLATAAPSTVSGSAMTYSSGWIANTGFTNTSFTEVVPAGKFSALALTGVLTSTVATGTAPLSITSTTLVNNLNSDLLDGQHGSYFEGRDTTAVGFSGGTLTLTRAAGNLTANLDGRYLPLAGGTMSGDLTATRIRGVNSLVLNTFTTINPASNVFLYSQPNDRDAWLFLDSADTGSNWGIYHRQIDSAVSGLPANSIGFIGGGSSALQAWISLANGSANFQGALTQAGNQVLHAGNYTSYALPIGGGTLTGGLSGTTGSFSGQITSTVATGTAPFVVASTTRVNNLNVQYLDGQIGAYYAAASSLASYLPKSGGAMTGALTLHSTGTNGFYNGTGDAATYALYNFKLGGWNGMALENLSTGGTYPSQVVGVINFREGTIDMKGGFKVNGASVITENQSITISGDASGTGKTAINLTLANSGVTAGTYRSVTVNAKGLVTAGTNPTTLGGYGITDALPIGGGALTGKLSINSTGAWNDAQALLTVGSGGDGRIQVRHIWGKNAANNNADHLWLNYQNANGHVQIGDNGGGNNLYVSGQLYAGGYFGGSLVLHAGNYGAYSTFTGTVTGTNFSGPGTGLTGTAASLTAGAVPWSGVTGKPTTLSGYGITDAMYQVDPNGFTQGDINGSGNMQRLWGTDSVQNLIAFRPPTTVEYTTDNVNWVATTISNDVFDGKVFGKWAGFNMNVGSNIGAWTKVRMTWVNFGYHFFSHFTLCHSTNGHSMNFVFYKSDLSGVFSSEAYRVNGISSWPGYTFTSHVNVSGWWDTRDVRMVFELNGNNGPSGYPNNAISIGHIGIMGGYSSFNRVFDWDGNRNITLFGNLTLPGNVSATGTVSGSSFSGAGTNLTGTANSLNVGGYSARWATGRTIALTGDVTGTSGAFDGTAALSFGVTIANSAVTYAKIQNVATASVLGNSSASVAQAPAALSMATLAGMLSNQTMNINGSSASCTGNAATATKSNSIAYPFLNTSLDLNTSGGSNELIAFNSYYPSGGAYNQPIAGAQHFRILQFGRYDSADSNFWRGQMAMSFYEDRMWFRRENALTWQSWREFIHSGNVGSYALPLTGGSLSGALAFSAASGTYINTGGGSDAFGYNATAGYGHYIKGTGSTYIYGGGVFWDGSAIRTLLHAGNYNSYAVDNTKRVKQFFWDSLGASTTQARRFEIARIAIDIVNWNQVGTFEIELHEQYYSKGIKKRYAVRYGYSGTRPGLTLVEMTGAGDNNFQVVLGSEQLVSGNHYYLPIYVDVRHYSLVDVRVTTSRQITTNSTPPVGYTYINSSPTPTNITDFTADSTVDISNAATAWQAGGNVLIHSGNYTSYPPARWATGRTISITGDVTGTSGAFDGTANLSFAVALANSGVTAGTYRSVTTDAKGRITGGTNPTTFSGYGITDIGYGSTTSRNVWQISDWNQSTYGNAHFLSSESNATNGPTTDFIYGLQTSFHRSGAAYRTQMVSELYSSPVSIWVRNSRDSDVWTTWSKLLHSNNYNSYAPTLTGGGASGTWGINISGSAAQLNGQAASYYENRDTTAVGFSGGTLTLTRAAGNLSVSLDGRYLTGNQTISLSGDLSGSGATSISATIAANAVTTTKINNSAVTYAKIQNVGAASVLGNTSASVSQAPQEITFANLGPYINGVARAWVTFNENPSTGAITINASLGISSVTRINYGQYRVNFSTAFADANYAVSGTIGYESNGGYLYGGFLNIPRVATPKTTTYCEVTASYGDGNTYNARFVHVVFDR